MEVQNLKIEIREMPEIKLAFITQTGMNGWENKFDEIVKWANSNHLFKDREAKVVRIFHDSIRIVGEDKVRMSIGVEVTETMNIGKEIEFTIIKGGKHLVGYFEIDDENFGKAWDILLAFMYKNGYKKGEGNPYEIYYNNYKQHPEKKYVVDICIPIE